MEHEIEIDETGPDFLLERLEHYLETAEFSDVVLVSKEADRLPAHRPVLASVSAFLSQIFKSAESGGDADGGALQLQFPETSSADLRAFLQLAYCGSIQLSVKRKRKLIGVLQMLQVSDDIVIGDDEVKVNDITIVHKVKTATNGLGNLAAAAAVAAATAENENIAAAAVAVPNVVINDKTPEGKAAVKGSMSLLKVDRPNAAAVKRKAAPAVVKAATVAPSSGVTVEFKTKKMKPSLVPQQQPQPQMILTAQPHISPIVTSSAAAAAATTLAAMSPAAAALAAVAGAGGGLVNALPLLPLVPVPVAELEPVVAATASTAGGVIFQGAGMVVDKEEADRITREMLDNASSEHGMNRRCERCQCPNCASLITTGGNGQQSSSPGLHVCHYATCGKKYKKTSHLRAHLRWHIGDQPFHCPWPDCGRKFTRSDELHRHYRIHTGEKNHKCSVCQKCFSRSDHLKKHLLSHAAAGHLIPANAAAAAATAQ